MKKTPITPEAFPAAAVERAEREAPQERSVPLQPGQAWQDAADEFGRRQLAWVVLVEALEALTRDPRISATPVALDFVRIAAELARSGVMAEDARQVFALIDRLLPLGEKGAQRVEQLSNFAAKGNKARIRYTGADKDRWRSLVASDAVLNRLSKRRCAELIALRERLSPQAVETIRKAI